MAYTTIDKPADYFNTKLYSGNSTDDTAITGVGFQPDWLWIKERTNTSGHQLQDVIRGATKQLFSNDSQAEATNTTKVKSFDSDGFTLGTSGSVNVSGDTYVAWNWLASNTTASNSDGSITSTVSANTTAGFSIVSYTGNGTAGATIGHGLGVAPSMIIAKRRSGVENWAVYHQSRGASKYINLDTTTAEQSSTSRWNGTEPTSSVFSVNTHGSVNGNGDTYIAYCFAEKKGYSKFGSYTGNGNADGTFIYTGFKPAWVLIKQSSASGEEWQLLDNKRNTFNPTNTALFPSGSVAENSGNDRSDFLSNGFKCRSTSAGVNSSGATYIYMAFAENPFVTSTGIPSCAR